MKIAVIGCGRTAGRLPDMSTSTRRFEAGEIIEVYGAVASVRDDTYVSDAVEADLLSGSGIGYVTRQVRQPTAR